MSATPDLNPEKGTVFPAIVPPQVAGTSVPVDANPKVLLKKTVEDSARQAFAKAFGALQATAFPFENPLDFGLFTDVQCPGFANGTARIWIHVSLTDSPTPTGFIPSVSPDTILWAERLQKLKAAKASGKGKKSKTGGSRKRASRDESDEFDV